MFSINYFNDLSRKAGGLDTFTGPAISGDLFDDLSGLYEFPEYMPKKAARPAAIPAECMPAINAVRAARSDLEKAGLLSRLPVYAGGDYITENAFRRYGYMSKGNKKLVSKKTPGGTRYLIWNVISGSISWAAFSGCIIKNAARFARCAFDIENAIIAAYHLFSGGIFDGCPYRTPHCDLFCYDQTAQNGYRSKTILPCRIQNFLFSLSPEFVDVMTVYIKSVAGRREYADAGKISVRIHEGGELYNQSYTDKIVNIARNFKDLPFFDFYTYSKSFPFLKKYAIPGGHSFDGFLNVNASIWDDTPVEFVEYIRAHNMAFYTVIEKEQLPEYREKFRALLLQFCRCKDCAACGQCEQKTGKIVVKHGHANK